MAKTAKLNLPKIGGEGQPKNYKIKLDAQANNDLMLYLDAYKEEYKTNSLKPEDLIAHIVKSKLQGDRAFRSYKKQANKQPGNGVAG